MDHLPKINMDSVATATKAMLDERFDGYVLVGFVAGTEHPMFLEFVGSPRTRMALESLLRQAVSDLRNWCAGGDDDDDDDEEAGKPG